MTHRPEVVALARCAERAAYTDSDPLGTLANTDTAITALRALDQMSVEERRDTLAAARSLAGFYAQYRRRMERRLP
mgnify:FL=1